MKLPVFDKKEDIPAPFLELYEEKDGKWVPKPDEDAEDVEGLKSALKKERDRADKAERERKQLEKERKDKERENKAKENGITDEQLKQIRAEVKAELEEEYKPIASERDTLKKDNRTLRLDTQVKALMGKKEVGVKAHRHDTLWRLIQDDFDLTDDGKPMVKDSPGTSVEKYLATKVKELYGEFYEGTQASGGGAAGDTKGTAQNTGAPSVEDVLSNPAAAMRAARAAGVTQ